MSSEIKVGFLFFLGIGLLLWFALFVTKCGGSRGEYAVHFPRVARLKEGDAVTYNGVKIGVITEVAPVLRDGVPAVRLGFTVEKHRRDSVLVDDRTRYLIVQGVLGGATLEIASRSGAPIAAPALVNAVGLEPTSIDDAFSSVRDLIEDNRAEVRDAIVAVRASMQEFGAMSAQVKEMVRENRPAVQGAVVNVGEMSGQVRDLVRDNRESIQAAILRFDAMAKQFEGMAREIEQLVADNRTDMRATIARLPEVAANIASAAKRIDEAVAENRESLKAAIDGFGKLGGRLDAIGRNIEAITTQVAEGKGTLGKLVMDDELHGKASGAIDNFNQRLEEVKPVTSGLSDIKFYAGIGAGMNTRSGVSRQAAWLRIEPRPWKFYEGGISYRSAPDDRDTRRDDPDKLGVDFNVLVGWRFFPDDEAQRYRLTVAGGLIDTKLGGLMRIPLWGDRLGLEVMGRQKDDQRDSDDRRFEEGPFLLRAALDYRVWKRIHLVAGVDDITGSTRGFWGGIRAELLDNDLRNITTVSGFAR